MVAGLLGVALAGADAPAAGARRARRLKPIIVSLLLFVATLNVSATHGPARKLDLAPNCIA
jgi:uncharacterized membrane protein YccC